MKVEEFLSREECARVKELLKRSSLLRYATAEERENWLNYANISSEALDLNGDKVQFLMRLWNFMGDRELLSDGRRRLGLIIILEYISVFDYEETKYLNEDEIGELKGAVDKYEEWRARRPQTPARAEIGAALASRRERAADAAPGRPFRINADDVLAFDLTEQMSFVTNKLKIAGAFPFTLGGLEEILKEYVIERIQRAISKPDRAFKALDVYLFANTLDKNVSGFEILDSEIRAIYRNGILADFFELERTDVLLTVWNRDVPLPEAKRIAASFWENALNQLRPIITSQSSRFVLLWVNVNENPLDITEFHSVPPLKCFELEDLQLHFRDCLKRDKVPEAEIESIVTLLSRHGGQLPNTYVVMRNLTKNVSA